MAKKTTKKETLEKQIEKQIEAIEASNDKIESTENKPTIETMINSINSVDIEIENDSEEQIQEITNEIIETLAPLKDLSKEINKKNNEPTFEEKILKANNVENLENIIKEEIETTKEMIEKVEKIKNNINSNTRTGFASVTNWWNGMGYDF